MGLTASHCTVLRGSWGVRDRGCWCKRLSRGRGTGAVNLLCDGMMAAGISAELCRSPRSPRQKSVEAR